MQAFYVETLSNLCRALFLDFQDLTLHQHSLHKANIYYCTACSQFDKCYNCRSIELILHLSAQIIGFNMNYACQDIETTSEIQITHFTSGYIHGSVWRSWCLQVWSRRQQLLTFDWEVCVCIVKDCWMSNGNHQTMHPILDPNNVSRIALLSAIIMIVCAKLPWTSTWMK